MEKSSTGRIILKTAIIATVAILFAVILIAVIIFLCFPYEGYKFADNMGMDRLALRFAENYEDDGNIDGLVYCVDKANKLLEKTENPSYALKLMRYTQKFFDYDNAEEYFAQLDDYYNDEELDFRIRVVLYSYMGHVISVNYKARTIVGGGEENSMIYKGEVRTIAEILREPLDIMDRSYIFSALSKQLLLNESVLVTEDGNMSDLYDDVRAAVSNQFFGLKGFDGDDMKRFYVLHQLYYFINGMKEFLGDNALGKDWEFFLDANNYTVNDMPLKEAYLQLYNQLNTRRSQ